MARDNRTNLQDTFLNEARLHRIPVTLFLTNGFQQRGTVVSYDGFTVLVVNDGKQHLIYKHAISTIVPSQTVEYYSEDGDGGQR